MSLQAHPLTLIGRRYQLGDRLGAGGMGAVYRALDRLTGQTVALKQVRMAEAGSATGRTESLDARLALIHEFETLASLRHPHIISVLDYGFDSPPPDSPAGTPPFPFFTMDLLDGAATLVEASSGLDTPARARLLVQVLQALAYLHRRGILHRDLKPENVLVAPGESGEPQARLLDFGLAIALRASDQGTASTAGTFAYMAPEVLSGDRASEASDLFSVGVLAYEALAGAHPFQGDSISTTISNVLHRAPDLDRLPPDDALRAVIGRLLARQPAARFASAAAAVEALRTAAGLPADDSPAVRESFLQAARFVSRQRELNELTGALVGALAGRGSGWLIGGESGVGKTRLLGELHTRALIRGAVVLRGQMQAEGGGLFSLWHEPLRRLCLIAAPNEGEASVLKPLIPGLADLLGRPVPDAPALPPDAAQTRLLAVVGGLLRRIPDPVVILLEDLQWIGSESLALLTHLAGLAAAAPLLIVGTYRDDERPELPGSLPDMRDLRLRRLDEAGIAALSESMLGPAGRRPEVIDLLRRETEGNAFFVVEAVRALAEEAGSLSRIQTMHVPERVVAGGIEQIIRRRLERVPAEARPLLEAAAVAGRWLDLNLLEAVLGGDGPDTPMPARLDRWMVAAADAAVFDVQNGRWCFAHDKLREAVLAGIPPGRAADLHRRTARSIEASGVPASAQAIALAHHWRQAGEADRELHYATLAGTQLNDTSAYRDALPYLRRALELCGRQAGPDAPAHELAIRHQLARACAAIGLLDAAAAHHRDNLALAARLEDRRAVALAERGLGDVAEMRGDYPAARGHFETSLAISQAADYPDGIARGLHALGRIANLTGDYPTAISRQQESIAICQQIGDRRGEGDALRALGSNYSAIGEYDRADESFTRSLEIARELGNRRGAAGALNNLGVTAEARGDFAAAMRYYEQSLALKREINDRRGVAITLQNIGVARYALREYAAAREALEEARAIFEGIGDRQGIADVLNNVGLCDYALGEYERARAALGESLRLCEELDDRWGVALGHLNIAKTWREQGEFARARECFLYAFRAAHEIQKHPTTLEIVQEYGALLAREGQTAEAVAHLTLAHADPRTPGLARDRAAALLGELIDRLPPADYAAADARGRAMSLEAAVAAALTP